MIKAVIFDLDGTLLNTIADLSDSVNHVLEANGFPAHSEGKIKSFVGNGLHKLMERAVPAGTSAETVERLFLQQMSYYRAHCQVKTKPYDGIPELLCALRNTGFKTAVISNKADGAVQDLSRDMFGNAFDYALGASDGVKLKPDRAMVDIALQKLGVKASEAVYVGDSQVDLETAKNAEMPCICVTWGFRSREVLIESGASLLADSPEELFGIISGM